MLRQIRDYFREIQQGIDEIPHFVFSNDEQALRDTVSGFSDFYLFVDYGEFSTTVDSKNRISNSIELAVTVAIPLGARPLSLDEVTDYQLESFDLCTRIQKRMWTSQQRHRWLKYLSDQNSILPFLAPNICRSIGHTLSFKIEGYDLLNIKESMP